MSEEPTATPTQTGPRTFLEIPALWARFLRMDETFFQTELIRASARNVMISVAVLTAYSAILSIFSAALGGAVGLARAPLGGNLSRALPSIAAVAIGFCCFEILATPIGFYLHNAILYVAALTFGGQGKFASQTYLVSLFFVPLSFLSGLGGLFTVIPTYGIYITATTTLAILVFDLALTARAFKVVHRLSTARAIGAVISPLVLVLIPACLILVLVLLGPAIGNVFSTINSQLGTPAP